MSIIKRYKAAQFLLENHTVSRDHETHNLKTLPADVKEALGFTLMILGVLCDKDYMEEAWDIYRLIHPFHGYITDQMMLIICKDEEVPTGLRAFAVLDRMIQSDMDLGLGKSNVF